MNSSFSYDLESVSLHRDEHVPDNLKYPPKYCSSTMGICLSEQKDVKKKRQQGARKKVCFAEKVSSFIENKETISEDEQRAMWYNSKDLARIEKERKDLVRAIRRTRGTHTAFTLDDSYCVRGLEEFTSIRAAIDKRNRHVASLQAVINAQQCEKLLGRKDPEFVRRLSLEATKASREQALELADRDAKDSYKVNQRKQPLRLIIDKERKCLIVDRLDTFLQKRASAKSNNDKK